MYVSDAKLCHTCLVSNLSRPCGTEARKVFKTRPNYFSTVLTRNDRNFTTKCVVMFGVPNGIIWVRFSTLAGPLGWAQKSRQNLTETFFCPTNAKRYELHPKKFEFVSSAKPTLICVPFSTFHGPVVPGLEKVIKISPRPFLPVRIKNYKKCVPNSVGISVVKIKFFPLLMQNDRNIPFWQTMQHPGCLGFDSRNIPTLFGTYFLSFVICTGKNGRWQIFTTFSGPSTTAAGRVENWARIT